MLKRYSVFLGILFIYSLMSAETLIDITHFASKVEGKKLLMSEDDYTRSWGKFDIESRVRKKGATKEELLDKIGKQSLDWTDKEKIMIRSFVKFVDQRIKELHLKLPVLESVTFVKTTGREEAEEIMGYTRKNYIVLTENLLTESEILIKHTVIHEIFHLYSRKSIKFRSNIYAIFGFEMTNDIDYPSTLHKHIITNPDATQRDSYITVHDGVDSVKCVMMLYSSEEYEKGSFIKYLEVGLLKLTLDSQKNKMTITKPHKIYKINEVTGFFEKIGQNTRYAIHPEEIAAENFVLLILGDSKMSNPELVGQLKALLQK